MNKKRRILASLIIAVMVVTMIPSFAVSAAVVGGDFVDMPNDWSTESLQKAVSNGLISGFNEPGGKYIKPSSVLTRAQMATIVNRGFGAENQTYLTGVLDVPSGEWYAKDMAKAVSMGTFLLAPTMRPNDPITRQEAFTVLARAFKLVDKDNGNSLYQFTDGINVASYAKSSVCAMLDADYVAGSNGYLNPTSNISRAEFAKVMDNLVKNYCDTSGEIYTVSSITGNVMVNEPGVTIKNTVIRGDLIIGDGVGSGNITLDNVDVKGRTLVRGGGVNTVIVKANCDIPSITIVKIEGNVRVLVETGGVVDLVTIDDGNDDVILEGEFGAVTINQNLPVIFRNATIASIQVNETATLTLDSDTVITKITVAKLATGTKVINSGLITKLVSEIKVTVSGTGTVTENLATGGTLELSSIAAVIGTPKVGVVLKAGVINPSGATVNYQWKSSTTTNGTYSNISGATSSTYTPVVADLNKYLKLSVTGKTSYTGTVTSVATAKVVESPITQITIPGITVPVLGATPVSSLSSTSEYTATIAWSPTASAFSSATIYTATIVLTPKTGYTLTGIAVNQFKVAGATSVRNAVNTATITAIFPATGNGLASGLNPVVSPLSTPGNEQVSLTVSIAPQTAGHKIYYKVTTTDPSARTLGSIATIDSSWGEITTQAGMIISGVADNKYIEVVEVLDSTKAVTKWGKAGPTSDGYPVPVPATGLTVTTAPLTTPILNRIQITTIDAIDVDHKIYYRVTSSSSSSAPNVGETVNLTSWTLLTEVEAVDGQFVEAIEVKISDSTVTKWGKSTATEDGYVPPAVSPISGGTSDATTIVLTFSGALTGSTADNNAFSVTSSGSAITVSSVNVAGSIVTISLSGTINTGELVSMTYTKPGTGGLTNGTLVESFSINITNNN